jgi:hypothetical protein
MDKRPSISIADLAILPATFSAAQIRRIEMPALHDDDGAMDGTISKHRQRRQLGGNVLQEPIAIAGLQGPASVHDGGEFRVAQADRRHQQTS